MESRNLKLKYDSGMAWAALFGHPRHRGTVQEHFQRLSHRGYKMEYNGMSMLHIAMMEGNQAGVEMLLDSLDVNIDKEDNAGNTPLHLAWSEPPFSYPWDLIDHRNPNTRSIDQTSCTLMMLDKYPKPNLLLRNAAGQKAYYLILLASRRARKQTTEP